jgi:hypothetical protein
MSSIFEDAGFTLPTDAPTKGPIAAPAAVASSSAPPQNIFSAAGFDVPTKSAPAPAAVADNIPTPEKFAADYEKTKGTPEKSTLQKIHEAIDPATLLSTAAKNTYADTLEHAAAGWQALKQGVSEIRQGNLAPSYAGPGQSGKSTDLTGKTTDVPGIPQYNPGGILRAAGGALGIPGALVSGPTNALISRPVTAVTGNPDIGDRAGVVANALVPFKGGSKIAEAAAPENRAVNSLVEAIRPENVPEVVAGMRANPRMTAADLSDPVRLTTQGLMAKGTPDVQDFISRAVRDRTATRLDNTNSAYTAAMGPAPDVGQMVEGLKQRARDAGQKAIQPALEGATPVDVSPVIKAIDEKLKPGINPLLDPGSKLPLSAEQEALARMKQQLTAPSGETLFDPQRLHRVQSDIGDQAFQLSKSADPKDRMLGSHLRNMNEKLIDQIDEASGGTYRPARQQFKDAKDIHQAFDEGFDVLKNRSGQSGFEDRPAALADWMKTATPEEVVAKRLGVRADMDQKINGVKNGSLAGQTVTAIPYNQEKLKTLFGDAEASRLIRVMSDAQREAATNAAIFSGSKTAETTAAGDRIAVRKVGGGNPLQYVAPIAAEMLGQSAGLPGAGLAASLAAKTVHMGAQKIGQMHDIASNAAFAKNALATGSAREQTINALLSHPKVISELKKRVNAVTAP